MMNSTTSLEYQGKPMTADPINWPSLNALVEPLRSGLPVIVILEPGDHTRYRLCIVPAWSLGVGPYLGDVGIPMAKSNDYLLVTKFDGHGGTSWFAFDGVGHWDLESLNNPWTRELLAWWLQELWNELLGRND